MAIRTPPHLLTIRLVDQWIDSMGDDGTPPATEQIDAIHAAIAAVDPGPLPVLMQGLVDATLAAWGRDSVAAGTAVLAYGRRLHHEGACGLASDVYETFIRYARAVGDHERLPDAYLRLGLSLRRHEDLDAALTAYATAGEIATAAGDRRVAWLARIGAANVARQRDHLSAACDMLDAVIAEVTPALGSVPGADDVLARASHDRAIIEIDAGRLETAVVLLYRALERYTDTRRRQRVLHDLALAFVDLGMLDVGRDALQVVSATTDEPYLRLLADSNLMWVAILAGQETVFERYRRDLAEESLTGELAENYAMCVREAGRRFGAAEGTTVRPVWDGAPPASITYVADAVREMRALVTVD
jgi:tetratricopeptide (TPR) repeat protein